MTKSPSKKKATDEDWMRAALQEAAKGLGRTNPNPAVGAVIVKNNRLLSSGWHRSAGQPHAEVEALRALKNPASAKGATIFITLEPCSTHGRTPPCTDAIVAAGISRVVYGATDPNPRHAGAADAILINSGVQVTKGVLEAECTDINHAWNHWIRTGRPWVILKAGMSLDGKITAPGNNQWITSPASCKDAMKVRARVDAILVGGETVRTDNPRLTVRGLLNARQPRRVIWTRNPESIPSSCKLLTDPNSRQTILSQAKRFPQLLRELGEKNITSILVEGGGKVIGAAIDSGLIDEMLIYVAPVIFGGPIPASRGKGVPSNKSALQIFQPKYRAIGSDIRISGRIRKKEKTSSKH